MASQPPVISVVIPHLNQPEGLDACLASLACQTIDHEMFEVIVVDNGSVVAPDLVAARYRRTRVLREPTPGPGPARNLGVRAATGDMVAFIDADCRADPQWLAVAYRSLCSQPAGTILGGDVRIWREHDRGMTAIEAYESVFAYLQKRYIEQHGFSGTGNLAMRRGDFDRVGPFAGIEFAEDIQWGQKARAAGCRFLYVPDMIIFHPARKSLRELCVKWDRHLQHYVNEARSRRGWQLRWLGRAAAVLISPLADWLKAFSSRRIHGLSARLKAVLVLIAIRSYRAWRMVMLLGEPKAVTWNRDTKKMPAAE